jgi:hypothetical protein
VVARIPPSDIEATLRMHGMDDPEDIDRWLYLVARLDSELVTIKQKEWDEKHQDEQRKAGVRSSRSRPRK